MVKKLEFNDQESALIREIQLDSAQSLTELASKVGMAQSTVWRKLQEFEASGLIKGRVALLDPAKLGAKLCVLASITLHSHTEEALAALNALVQRNPQILECHAVSGAADYILKVRVADVEAYDSFMTHQLLRNEFIQSVTSSFVLREIKNSTALPV